MKIYGMYGPMARSSMSTITFLPVLLREKVGVPPSDCASALISLIERQIPTVFTTDMHTTAMMPTVRMPGMRCRHLDAAKVNTAKTASTTARFTSICPVVNCSPLSNTSPAERLPRLRPKNI